MERIVTYDIKKRTLGFSFNSKTLKWEYRDKFASVTIDQTCNDLRYCGYGLQSIFSIAICFPTHWIAKTIRNKKPEDLQRCEDYINKHLKKNGYKKVSFVKDFDYELNELGETPKNLCWTKENNKGWFIESQYQITNIKKENQ